MSALKNFSDRAQRVIAKSRREADLFGNSFVGTEHLLLALLRIEHCMAAVILERMGLDLESVLGAVEKGAASGPGEKALGHIPYTPRVKKVLSLAAKASDVFNHPYVGTEHLLLGLVREGESFAAKVLFDFGVDLEKVRSEIFIEAESTRNCSPSNVPNDESVAVDPPPVAARSVSTHGIGQRMNRYVPLTAEEKAVLHQMTSMKKWDALSSDVSILVPTMLIAGYGIWQNDAVIAWIGIGMYIVLRLRTTIGQERLLAPLQSGIRKLMNRFRD